MNSFIVYMNSIGFNLSDTISDNKRIKYTFKKYNVNSNNFISLKNVIGYRIKSYDIYCRLDYMNMFNTMEVMITIYRI